MDLWDKKSWIIGTAIVFALILAIVGYTGTDTSDELTEEDLTAIAEYEENLENYDLIIEEAKDNIALNEEQVANLQDYVDNSIYMKLDSQAIEIGNARYSITDATSASNVLSAFTTYINDGGLKAGICEILPEIPVEYLKELITCSTSGNTLSVTVMHYDSETLQRIMHVLDELIVAQKDTIASINGDFNISRLGISYYTRADITVTNNQNTYLNNLKNYQNSLADYQKKLIDGRNNRDNYIRDHTPDAYNDKAPESPIKNAIIYLIFGGILGGIIACAVIALRFVTSTRLRDTNELLNAGLATLGLTDGNGKYQPELDRSILDIQLMAENSGADSVFLGALEDGEDYQKVISDYSSKLKEAGVKTSSGTTGLSSADEVRTAMAAKNAVLIVKIGHTRYEQIEEQLKLYQKFGISMWGCVVIG